MNKQEFTQRTGFTPTDEEYKAIEVMYLEAGNIDKDVFCEDWKQHKDSILLAKFYERFCQQEEKADGLVEQRSKTVEFLLRMENETDDERFGVFAAELIGEARVIKRKLSAGYELSASEKDYIVNNLG